MRTPAYGGRGVEPNAGRVCVAKPPLSSARSTLGTRTPSPCPLCLPCIPTIAYVSSVSCALFPSLRFPGRYPTLLYLPLLSLYPYGGFGDSWCFSRPRWPPVSVFAA